MPRHPLVRKLHQQRAWVAKLEAEAERMVAAQLASLPEDYGFASAAEFISAVLEASKPSSARRKARRKTS